MNRVLLSIAALSLLTTAPLKSQHAPTEVTGRLYGDGQLELSFRDHNQDEHGFLVYIDGASSLWKPLMRLPPASGDRVVHVIDFPPHPHSRRFMVRAYGPWGYSRPSERIEFHIYGRDNWGEECDEKPVPDRVLCFGEDGRFVMWASILHRLWGKWRGVRWKQFAQGESTGFGWAFSEDNIEVTVKLLDGCNHNGSMWFFAAATTDLMVHMNLLDRRTGLFKSWYIDAGETESEEIVNRWLRLYPDGDVVRGKTWYRVTQGYGFQDTNAFRACWN